VLLGAALSDVRARRIPNGLPVCLALLGLARLLTCMCVPGASPVLVALGDLALTAAVFLAGAGIFAAGCLGGGDVKLLAASCLWLGAPLVPGFLLATALVGSGLVFAKVAERALAANRPADLSLPYGLAIAAGGVATTPGLLPGG
jgi:prepilin peptidase CpaA